MILRYGLHYVADSKLGDCVVFFGDNQAVLQLSYSYEDWLKMGKPLDIEITISDDV